MRGKQTPTPRAVLISLSAVLVQAVLAMILSGSAERLAVFTTRILFPPRTWAVVLSFPLLLALAGHYAGMATAREPGTWLPSKGNLLSGVQILPIAIVWGA